MAVIRIIQVLWKINPFYIVLLLLFLLTLYGLIIYNYYDLVNPSFFLIGVMVAWLVLLPFVSIRIAVTIAEFEIISGWGKWRSVAIGGGIISFPLLFLVLAISMPLLYNFFEINDHKISLRLLAYLIPAGLIIGSILLGWYLGVKAIEDNPNYRAIRDRSVWLFHVFGKFGTRFQDSDLSRADFSFAFLKNADLTNANLKGANLTNANLTNADLEGANFSETPRLHEQIKSACNWRLAVLYPYVGVKWDDENKIWVPEDEEANQRKIKEIESDEARELCSKKPTQ